MGVLRLVVGVQHRGTTGWGWALTGGVVTILLGLMILAKWPPDALWVIGLFIAVELIVNGWTQIFVGPGGSRSRPDDVGVRPGPGSGQGVGSGNDRLEEPDVAPAGKRTTGTKSGNFLFVDRKRPRTPPADMKQAPGEPGVLFPSIRVKARP